MRILTAVVALVFQLLAAPALGREPLKLPVPEIETLANGLKVAWFPSATIPVVDLILVLRSGSRDDAQGKSGTAELLSSLLDRGAGGLSAQEIAKAVEDLGASRYASADDDTFSVGMHGLAPDAPALLDLLGKMVIRPDFPEAEVSREHARLLDRWSHIADYGESLAGLAYRRVLSSGTSYGRGGFSSMEEFKKVGREDVLSFHRRHFTPANALLVVVGKVDRASFREKVLASFGGWQGAAPARDWKNHADKRLAHKRGTVLLVDRPGLTQAQVRMGFRAPLLVSPEHYPLVVANAMLGEYFNSRLNSLIRDKLGLTYGIGSGFSYSRELATFTISSATKSESVGQLIRKSIDVLKDLKRGPIPADEIRMAKEYLIGGFPLAASTLGAVASRWLGGYLFDLGPEYLNEFVPRVEKVTPADVIGALSKSFDLDQLVIVVAGDAREIEKSLKGWTVRRVSAKELY